MKNALPGDQNEDNNPKTIIHHNLYKNLMKSFDGGCQTSRAERTDCMERNKVRSGDNKR
jgi:hypothetical protein